jgi:hypothetical protein
MASVRSIAVHFSCTSVGAAQGAASACGWCGYKPNENGGAELSALSLGDRMKALAF